MWICDCVYTNYFATSHLFIFDHIWNDHLLLCFKFGYCLLAGCSRVVLSAADRSATYPWVQHSAQRSQNPQHSLRQNSQEAKNWWFWHLKDTCQVCLSKMFRLAQLRMLPDTDVLDILIHTILISLCAIVSVPTSVMKLLTASAPHSMRMW